MPDEEFYCAIGDHFVQRSEEIKTCAVCPETGCPDCLAKHFPPRHRDEMVAAA